MYTRNANIMKIIRLHVLIYIKVKLLCIIFSQCDFQRLCARCLPPVREQCIQTHAELFESTFFLPRSLVSRIHFTFNSDQLLLLCFIFLSELHCFRCPFIILSYRDDCCCLPLSAALLLHIILHVSEPGPLMMMLLPERVLSRLVLSN